MTAPFTRSDHDEVARLLAGFLRNKGPKGVAIVNRWLRRHRWRAARAAGGAA